jgi:hypothetical protein
MLTAYDHLPPSMRISKVSVVDVDMPFASMVWFMVKWAIATIPALLILFAAGVVVSLLFGGLLTSLVNLLR